MDRQKSNTSYQDYYDLDEEEEEEYKKEEQVPIQLYPEGENYAKLCRLLFEGSTMSMRHVFDQIHSPMSLVERLASASMHKTLRRMKVQGVLMPEQWDILYPRDKQTVSSAMYSPVMLYILLKSCCHISAPYPNHWDGLPEDRDHSLGAELVRMNHYLTVVKHLPEELTDKEYKLHSRYIMDIITKLSSSSVATKLEQSTKGRLQDTRSQDKYKGALDVWYEEYKHVKAKEKQVQKILNMRGSHHELVKLGINNFPRGSEEAETESEVSRRSRTTVTGPGGKEMRSSMYTRRTHTSLSSGHRSSTTEAPSKATLRSLEKEIISKYHKQVTESIKAEDVVPKMVQRGMLSHEEKNKIMLQTTNPSRMKMMFDVILKKGGNGFDVFCDVIKFKYKGVYNILTDAKSAPFLMDRPDEASECCEALRSHYSSMVSSMPPIPWNTTLHLPLREFYQKIYLTDVNGRHLDPTEIFQPHVKSQRPRRALIEGQAGVGKTTMAKYFVGEWAKARDEGLVEKFKLVFYLDLRTAIPGDVLGTIAEQCLPENYKKSVDELYNIIKGAQKRALFILDGYEYLKGLDDEFMDLLHKTMFKDCYIAVLLQNQFVSPALQRLFDTRLTVLGLRPEATDDFVQNYIKFSETSPELYEHLNLKLHQPDQGILHMFALNPLHCMCVCLITEYDELANFTTLTTMLQSFIKTLMKRFCKERGLKLTADGFPPEVVNTINVLDEVAFENLVDHKILIDVNNAMHRHNNEDIKHLGLLHSCAIGSETGKTMEMGMFSSVLFQEILAARFLLRIELDDFPRYIELLTTERHLINMTSFFCGLLTDMVDDERMNDIFDVLSQSNLQKWKGVGFIMNDETNSHDTITQIDPNQDKVEGRLSDYQLSLQCLTECEGREDMAKYVVESLPRKIYTKSKDIINASQMIGLSHVLRYNSPILVELDLRLNHLGNYYMYAMTELAAGVESSTHISQLRLRWTDETLLAVFLSGVFGSNTSIGKLKIYDELRQSKDTISATVWANFWSARKKMKYVQVYAFSGCRNPALVSGIIRNIPENVEELFLNNCRIDMIAAKELAKKMDNNRSLKLINLNGAEFKKPDFQHITSGVKHTESLSEINLGNTKLDTTSTLALAEALKFNKSLRRLDLTGASFHNEGCRTFGLGLALNKTILEVNLLAADITPEGVEEIKKLKRESVNLLGLGHVKANAKN